MIACQENVNIILYTHYNHYYIFHYCLGSWFLDSLLSFICTARFFKEFRQSPNLSRAPLQLVCSTPISQCMASPALDMSDEQWTSLVSDMHTQALCPGLQIPQDFPDKARKTTMGLWNYTPFLSFLMILLGCQLWGMLILTPLKTEYSWILSKWPAGMIQTDTAMMREQVITIKVGTILEKLWVFCIFMKCILMTDILLLPLGIQLRSPSRNGRCFFLEINVSYALYLWYGVCDWKLPFCSKGT